MKKHYLTSLASLLILSQASLVNAELITPKIHSVSSQNPVPGREAANTVNGSGLSEEGSHLALEDKRAWTTIGTYAAKDLAPFIVYDLGVKRDVHSMHIWNFNSAIGIVIEEGEASTWNRNHSIFGVHEYELLTSDDGKKFKSHGLKKLEQATGKNSYKGQRVRLNLKNVRFIKLAIKSTHDGTIFDGTGKKNGKYDGRALTGLSEVRFIVPGDLEYNLKKDHFELTEGTDQSFTYGIRLKEQPKQGQNTVVSVVASDKTLSLNGGNAGAGVRFSFSDKDWNQWKRVTVRAIDDSIYTSAHNPKINHFIEKSGDTTAAKLTEEITVNIKDNDQDIVENLKPIDPAKRMEWFRDIKYYLFIHWGPSTLGGEEISWSRSKIGKERYDNFYKKFNPTQFNADEWVKFAKDGGFKTIVMVSRHHDGFCLWDTKTTDYSIMSSPFKRDILKELSVACKKHGLRFSLYYSTPDWHHPDWWAPGYGGPTYTLAEKGIPNGKDVYEFAQYAGSNASQIPKGQKPNNERFLKHMHAQVKEILTNYGDISLMWWDGSNPLAFGKIWDKDDCVIGRKLENVARKMQPAMVQNNRAGYWKNGHWWTDEIGDYDSSELGKGAFNMKSPWEYTWNLGTQWACRPNDSYKSAKTIIRDDLIQVVGRDGNFLMNVGPDRTGKFEEDAVKSTKEIGNWLRLHGESIYGTRAGPYKPSKKHDWGLSTRKGNTIYLHVLNWPSDGKLTLLSLGEKILSSELLTGGKVKISQQNDELEVKVPRIYQKEILTIVKLTIEGDVMEIQPIDTQ